MDFTNQPIDQFAITLEDIEMLNTKNCSARKPQAVILHYTAGNDASSEGWLTTGPVSANYLLRSDATVAQIVPDGKRAWHAGDAFWRGLSDLNSLALGVEITGWGFDGDHVSVDADRRGCIMVKGSDKIWFPFPEKQFQSLAALLVDFKKCWKIKPELFIGHSDVAPSRKIDPGPLFPWERLHREFGVGAWPDLKKDLQHVELPSEAKKIKWTQMRLRDYGYGCSLTEALDTQTILTLQAFQMHFRPSNISGALDDETLWILAHLVDQYHYGLL